MEEFVITVNDTSPGLPAKEQIHQLARRLHQAKRGLIIVGPQSQKLLETTLLPLAQQLNYPILADPLSQLRGSASAQDLIISSYDAFFHLPRLVDALAPDIILRFGAMPTSKPLLLYIKDAIACPQVIIDGNMGWDEPTYSASELIRTEPTAFCAHLLSSLKALDMADGETFCARGREWAALWHGIYQRSQHVLTDAIHGFPDFFEGRVFTELATLLPSSATIYRQ